MSRALRTHKIRSADEKESLRGDGLLSIKKLSEELSLHFAHSCIIQLQYAALEKHGSVAQQSEARYSRRQNCTLVIPHTGPRY